MRKLGKVWTEQNIGKGVSLAYLNELEEKAAAYDNLMAEQEAKEAKEKKNKEDK